MSNLKTKMDAALWCAHELFQKGLANGSSGNLSFRDEDKVYISSSGSSFGRLSEKDFAVLDLNGNILSGNPSKEYPIHLALYQCNEMNQAVIHTHSFYSTLFSCLKDTENNVQRLFSYTPYLHMLTNGKINCVEFAQPGSKKLFDLFEAKINTETKAYILKNHGIVTSAKDLYSAFNLIEEFETSTRLDYSLGLVHSDLLDKIK